MKHIASKLIFPLLLVIAIIPATATFSADISIGASTWYSTWIMKTDDPYRDSKETMGPELMYGPVLSFGIVKGVSVSSVFLYGSGFMMGNSFDSSKTKLTRMDSDTLINYSISRYFKVFGGFKYMRFSFQDGVHHSGGPGAGLGMTLPIVDNLFFVANGSASYLFGSHEDPGSEKISIHEYGYNVTGSLTYYFATASTSASIGYRYQSFKTKYQSGSNSDMESIFHGLTASVIYSF